jgi:hypothetical protein
MFFRSTAQVINRRFAHQVSQKNWSNLLPFFCIVVNLVEADGKTLTVSRVFIKGLVTLGLLNE